MKLADAASGIPSEATSVATIETFLIIALSSFLSSNGCASPPFSRPSAIPIWIRANWMEQLCRPTWRRADLRHPRDRVARIGDVPAEVPAPYRGGEVRAEGAVTPRDPRERRLDPLGHGEARALGVRHRGVSTMRGSELRS